MIISELRPGLYRLRLGRYQAYAWRDGASVTLVDTGEAGSGPAIAAGLAELGLTPGNLDRVVLTHFHDDHTGSAAELASWGPVRIVAHALDAPVVRGERPGPPPNFTPFERDLHAQVAAGLVPAPPVRVDDEVRDGDVLDFGGGARVISTPGHTDGSLALHLPEHGVLLTGDIAAEHGGQVMFGVFHLDRAVAAESLRRLAELDVEVACFGHGEPVLGDASARLREAAALVTT
ncbi:MBL fold metallo-hydrolase [Plantactinospora sonchi]|uniref:MBL fold metallo-hydrolase n=1 Tax=Plantactinospora sonchi TaxID=1544735 RepID=A0ABU7S2I8_9ACTN